MNGGFNFDTFQVEFLLFLAKSVSETGITKEKRPSCNGVDNQMGATNFRRGRHLPRSHLADCAGYLTN